MTYFNRLEEMRTHLPKLLYYSHHYLHEPSRTLQTRLATYCAAIGITGRGLAAKISFLTHSGGPPLRIDPQKRKLSFARIVNA
jgi:hypothetical protein